MKTLRTAIATGLLYAAFLAITTHDVACAYDRLTAIPVVEALALARPRYLQEMKDPTIGTVLIRVTAPGKEMFAGVSCQPLGK